MSENSAQVWTARRGYPARKHFNSHSADSDFQRDRARVIHSAAFRQLQSKTQVLGIGESDFYRTRLTHSLEVAQIGSGICERLRERYQVDDAVFAWLPSMSLIEAVCLSHDLGHPPFGHGGEVALNYMMRDHGGFEGNGQTLRIISRLGEYSLEHGLDLTRRTKLGVLKYPGLHGALAHYASTSEVDNSNLDAWIPPKCILDAEADVLDWILEPFSAADRQRFQTYEQRSGKHSRTLYKSFDTSIMDIADDIAYGVHDLEDALAMRLVDFKQWQQEVVVALGDAGIEQIGGKEIGFYSDNLFSGQHKARKHAISNLVNYFIAHIEVVQRDEFEHPLLKLKAQMQAPAGEVLALLKDFIFRRVIKRPEVQAFEYKGQMMILKLFDALADNPMRLLPEEWQEMYREADNKQRVLCDYMASMTDSQATKLYHRFFTPSMGSVFDRI